MYITYILGPTFKDTLTGMGATFLNYKDDNYARDLISLSGNMWGIFSKTFLSVWFIYVK